MTMHDRVRDSQGELYAALAAMGFGSAYVATAVALPSFDPVPVAVWRSALAAGALALMIGIGRRAAHEPAVTTPSRAARAARLLVMTAFGGPLFLASMNLAVAHVGATIASFVAGLYAVLAAVIAPVLLPERLTVRALAGFGIALAGTALLAELDVHPGTAAGIAWGLLAATSFALYVVLARRWSTPYRLDGLTVALALVSLTALALGAIVLATNAPALVPTAPTIGALAAIAWLAVVAAMGPILTVASLRRIPAARFAAFLLLNPVTATVLAAAVLGERPTLLQAGGGLLVLVGMAMVTVPLGVRGRRLESPGAG